jgi:hypothetical protein
MGNSPHAASIHILDDDSLLNVFNLYRPFLLGEDQDDGARLPGGERAWVGERWWYRLAHVCQRWRNLILGSAPYLGLSLVCTKGTPVADMLAHSPSLPLVIDFFNVSHDISAEDERGIILALKQRHRVRRIRLWTLVTNVQKLIGAIDEEYPVLEYLVILPQMEDNNTILTFPETFQAPHLRHLAVIGFAFPMASRLLTTALALVTLALVMVHPSTHFQPNVLLHWISFMPQLETLAILYSFPIPNHDLERQLTHTPTMTPVTLPNLHFFRFRGGSTYLEAVVRRIAAPHLEKLQISFFSQLTFSVPCLLHFMNTTENLRFDSAIFRFSTDRGFVAVHPREAVEMHALSINVNCWHLDWQVSSIAQILSALSQMLSPVEHLTLQRGNHTRSSEEHNEADRSEWRKLLRSFSNVKTLHIGDELVEELSRCLQLEDGELELLPELQELTYSGSGNTGDAFTSFMDARQNVGHPVALTLC